MAYVLRVTADLRLLGEGLLELVVVAKLNEVVGKVIAKVESVLLDLGFDERGHVRQE